MSTRHSFLFLLSRLQAEINRLFHEFEEVGEVEGGGQWVPTIDIVESDDLVTVLVAVPGVAAADLLLEVAGNQLTVEGSKSVDPPQPERRGLSRRERGSGSFRCHIPLPLPVNNSRAEAELENGVLRIRFPKVEDQRQRPRRLEVVVPSSIRGAERD